MSQEVELQVTLEDEYPKLFEVVSEVKPRDPETCEAILRKIMGDDLFNQVFTVEKYIKPVKEFQEKRAALRTKLSVDRNATIDDLTAQVQYSPAFSFKRRLEGE